jgi:hypothetical protein
MKKLLSLAALCIATFMSCSDSADFEIHQTYFTPTSPEGIILHADQTVDSIRVISYDPWTAQTNFVGDEWFTITPTVCNFNRGEKVNNTRIDITASPNTTNKIRGGLIFVNSIYTIGMSVHQLSWLNIQFPVGRSVTTDNEGNELSDTDRYCVFETRVREIKGQFEVIFTTYANNATLTSDAEWLTPVEENFANAGHHVVNINCEANPTEVERSATLLLTSNGITTPITITQERKRD